MNALLSSQDDSSPDSSSPSSPDSHTLSHHSTLSQHSERPSLPDLSHLTEGRESQTSQHYHSTKAQSTNTSVNTSTLSNRSQSSHSSQSSNSLSHKEPSDPGDLPYLHPDVLQQQFSAEVSLLPVPRIVGPVPNSSSHGYDGSTLGTALHPRGYWNMAGSDSTLDENMQLADMIAVKYLGNKLAMDSSIQHTVRQPVLAPGTWVT